MVDFIPFSFSFSPEKFSDAQRMSLQQWPAEEKTLIFLIKECKLPVRTDCKTVILIQLYTTLTLFPLRVKVYWKVNPVSPSVDPGYKNVFWILWPPQPKLLIRTSSGALSW